MLLTKSYKAALNCSKSLHLLEVNSPVQVISSSMSFISNLTAKTKRNQKKNQPLNTALEIYLRIAALA